MGLQITRGGSGGGSRVQHTLEGKQAVCKGCCPQPPMLNDSPPTAPPERLLELSVCTLMLQGLNHSILPGAGAGAGEHTVKDLHKVSDLHGVENLLAVNS